MKHVPKGSIKVSEQFYSVQGEGATMGVPAVFLRLQGCNLLCKWPCDTIEVWKQGREWSFEEIVESWKKEGWWEKLISQEAHLVITGGEPVLQWKQLIPFVRALKDEGVYLELETNATLEAPGFYELIDQINASPKLKNSGVPLNKRYIPAVIEYLVGSNNCWFKFVVDSVGDLGEVFETYITARAIEPNRIILMPEATSREELIEKEERVIGWCKQYGYRYSSRLQIHIWNKLRGV